MIIDTHAHYDDKAFDGDRDELISSLFVSSFYYSQFSCLEQSLRKLARVFAQKP